MYALFEDAGKFHAGRVHERDRQPRCRSSSAPASAPRSRRPTCCCASPARSRTALLARRRPLAGGDRPRPRLGVRARGRVRLRRAGPRLLRRQRRRRRSRPPRCSRLFGAPHYFRRLGKGRFKKAPEEIVKAALLGIERKKQIAAQVDAWAAELVAGACPPADPRAALPHPLQARQERARVQGRGRGVAKRTQRPPLELLKAAGAIDSPYQFHWRRFLFEQFPKGAGFAAVGTRRGPARQLPLAPARAFSIDDSQTTEIDDALSVQGLGSGSVVVGIHIAAPALGVAPGLAGRPDRARAPLHRLHPGPQADDAARRRWSRRSRSPKARGAGGLAVRHVDEATLAIARRARRGSSACCIAANLRHDQLDADVNEATLAAGLRRRRFRFARRARASCTAWRAHLKAAREVVRGKPENFNRPDYTFRLDVADGERDRRATSASRSATRRRGSPLDLIVAEAMILANSTWGGWLAELRRARHLPQPGEPGARRQGAHGHRPAPHAGMGVAQYAWATSPLRRYVDLVNQWQIVACARHGRTAALAAPFKPKDVSLSRSSRTSTPRTPPTTASRPAIERYWALQYLAQNGIDELDATVMKDGLVRADNLPLVFRAVGAESLPRGSARSRPRRRGRPADARPARPRSSRAAPMRRRRRGVPMRPTRPKRDDEDAEAAAGPLAHRHRRRADGPDGRGRRRHALPRVDAALPAPPDDAAARAACSRSACTRCCSACASSTPRASTACSRRRRSR